MPVIMHYARIFVIFSLIALMILPSTLAVKGHLKLLAVQEEISKGSIADLYLEIIPGQGRVFFEISPLTKVDTQISARFAKDIACSQLNIDCNKLDFVYIIKSSSYIVGGPSAGAAITVLTMALLDGFVPDPKIAMTGTINSGGYIGPVSGIKAKIDAAADSGLRKVLIPSGTRFFNNDSVYNATIDLVEYGKRLGIEVKEVVSIDDALYEFTGRKKGSAGSEIVLDKKYVEIMKMLAEKLCSRTVGIQKKFLEAKPKVEIKPAMVEEEVELINLSLRAKEAFEEKNYYSAASYCYGSNSKYRKLYLVMLNISPSDIAAKAFQLNNTLSAIESEIDAKSLSTVTDLQAYLIVKERLAESFESLGKILDGNESSAELLAYAMERSYSAVSWSNFFGIGSSTVLLDNSILKMSCMKKIAEAEERIQYTMLFIPLDIGSITRQLQSAKHDLSSANYALCLFKASKAKANADLILNNIGVQEDQLHQVVINKLSVVKKSIAREISKGIFPILGYSYYEYASSLEKHDPLSALMYVEYATELSNFDMYFSNGMADASIGTAYILSSELGNFRSIFEKGVSEWKFAVMLKDPAIIFIAGLAAGLLASMLAIVLKKLYTSKKHIKPAAKKR